MGPAADAREEVTLGHAFQVRRGHVLHVAVIHDTGVDDFQRRARQDAQPRGCLLVVFVVVVHLEERGITDSSSLFCSKPIGQDLSTLTAKLCFTKLY